MWVCALQSCLSDCQVNVAIDRVDRTRGYSHVTADRWEVQSVAGSECVCVCGAVCLVSCVWCCGVGVGACGVDEQELFTRLTALPFTLSLSPFLPFSLSPSLSLSLSLSLPLSLLFLFSS